MVPHLKLFSICSITGLPRNVANICQVPGLAQARPHDAMHLPSNNWGESEWAPHVQEVQRTIVLKEVDSPTSPPVKDTDIRSKKYCQIIFLHAREFYTTLREVVCRSLLYAMPTGTPLRRTISNTTASELSENISSPGLCNANIYLYLYLYREDWSFRTDWEPN